MSSSYTGRIFSTANASRESNACSLTVREIRRKAPKSPVEALQTAALPGPASDTARDSGRGSERFAFRRGLRAGQM